MTQRITQVPRNSDCTQLIICKSFIITSSINGKYIYNTSKTLQTLLLRGTERKAVIDIF